MLSRFFFTLSAVFIENYNNLKYYIVKVQDLMLLDTIQEVAMKYYLVALFDNDSLKDIERLQRSIGKKYKNNKNQSLYHITLDVIGDTDIEKIDKIINKILKPYKKFKVEINNAICFDEPYKTINLQVENKGYISRLARLINVTLKLHGINARATIQDRNLNVS